MRSIWKDVPSHEYENHGWQEKNSITRLSQLKDVLEGVVSPSFYDEIEAGLVKVGMSIRLTPYVMDLINWENPDEDPIRRQFIPMYSELEKDHPCLTLDSLHERELSPVTGVTHRYPDKVLFLTTSVCPVYCQYCTRSYAVGQSTELVEKDLVASMKFWKPGIEYIGSNPEIEDIVISGGDVARLKAKHIRQLGNELLDIEHVRRLRFASKVLSVLPMKILTDPDWVEALMEIVERGRSMLKDVCLHTHFNHPNEVTPTVEKAMELLHGRGLVVRNQTVLLRRVNDDAETLRSLIKKLSRVVIHPYYVYLCDMVKGTEHFRLPLRTAQKLEKEIRGTTAGFNTPLFIVDTPAGKRDVDSCEFYNTKYGVSAFSAPAVTDGLHYYYDPLRSLVAGGRLIWKECARDDKVLTDLVEPQALHQEMPLIFPAK